jgi:hypothetical protein
MDDFRVADRDYFQEMYRDIYPAETCIQLVSNKVTLKPGRLVECKLLDTLIYVDAAGIVHVTLYDKREDYNFFVNRFLDIDSNACKFQSISSFHSEIVGLFRLNTHSFGFFEIGPGTGISGLQYAICHWENLAICHMLIQILINMQYANGISCGSVRKVPGRASFRLGRTAKYRPTPQPCVMRASRLKTRIGSGERI